MIVNTRFFAALASLLLIFSPHWARAEKPIATIRVATDSQNRGYEVVKAFDGDPATFWHSQFSGAPFEDRAIPIYCGYNTGCNIDHPRAIRSRNFSADRPFELRIDLGDVFELSGFRYTPRSDGNANGTVGRFRAFAFVDDAPASNDDVDQTVAAPDFCADGVWNADYGAPVVEGEFDPGDSTETRTILFPQPTKARRFVFQILTAANGLPFASAAELELLSPDALFRAPTKRKTLAQRVDATTARAWARELTGADDKTLDDSPYFADLVAQYDRLVDELDRLEYYEAIAEQAATRDALILPDDRDPTDVAMRRVRALQRALRENERADDAELALLKSLDDAVASTPLSDVAARFKLYLTLCVLRRSLALQRPELDFDRILFVKRKRSNYSHICDQFYGRSAVPGGGLFVLSQLKGDQSADARSDLALASALLARALDPRADALDDAPELWARLYAPQTRDLLENSRVVNDARLKGRPLVDGAFLAPELSFDAKTIAFAWCECKGSPEHVETLDLSRGHTQQGRCWHIFTCDVDGGDLRQITDGTWNDFDPCFLPNGRMAFISERRGGYLRCGRDCPNYTLFDMNCDGSKMRPLSVHETNEWAPSVSNDGQILWTRWDYIDRFGCIAHGPWTTSPDGRNPRAVCGNYAPRHLRPDSVLDIRAIPDSNKLVATAGPHHGQSFGSIIEIDPNAPDDPISPIIRMMPDVGFPESQNGSQVWGTPWPLSEDLFLAVADYSMGIDDGREGGRYVPGAYALYLVDAFGNRELIYRDPELSVSTPIPMVPRPTPPVVPSLSDPDEIVDRPYFSPPDFDAPRPQGVVAIQNVYEADQPIAKDKKIAAIRVVQVFCMSGPSGSPPYEIGVREATATDSVKLARRVWGTAPVEEDGSACFYAPADCEIYFQTLDENGVALQSMRSGTALRVGERLGCVGCHESRETAAATGGDGRVPIAFRREPSTLTAEGEGTAPVSFPLLVQPILDAKCVECHATEDARAKNAPDLSRKLERGFYASYANLADRGYVFHDFVDPLRTPTERFGARASKWPSLLADHYGVELTDGEWRRIALWLDTTSNFFGVYEKEGCEQELRGERAVPTLE